MSDFTLHCGDAIQVLKTFPDESVQCCVTSPPYWGLRDYGTPPQIWGGVNLCQHDWQHERWYTEQSAGSDSSAAFHEAGPDNAARLKKARWREADTCRLCGAWRGSLGLEPTPEMFVGHLVDVFREVRRALKDDGTLWLNLGDSYSAHPGQRKVTDKPGAKQATSIGSLGAPSRSADGMKPKDLVGIPWMIAFALRTDGWWLRSEIIWHKVNPMPESVQDRPTRSHEQLFLLAKSGRYFYDAAAIKEPAICDRVRGPALHPDIVSTNGKSGLSRASYRSIESPRIHGNIPGRSDGGGACNKPDQDYRNKRSVWTIISESFPDAHFAVMPEALVEPCILAGSQPGDAVLDPFCGAGTVGAVSLLHNRNFVGIDLNPEYLKMARGRLYRASSQLLGDREITQEIAI